MPFLMSGCALGASWRHVYPRAAVRMCRFISTSPHRMDEGNSRPAPSQMHSLLDIGSRSIFSSDHDILRQNARRFFQDEVAPRYFQWEKEGNPDRETWEKAGQNGFLGITIPADKGGIGGTFLDATVVLEEQAYTNCMAPAFSLHSDIVLPYIANYGSKEQVQRYVPDTVAGKKILAIAMTEPGAGSDLQGIRTNAKKDGDDYILNGSKTFITNGWLADVVVVVAVTNPQTKSAAHGISLLIVEEGTPGFKRGKKLKKMGCLAQDTAELFFEDVRIPKSALLGKENHGFYYLMNELSQERLSIATIAAAHAEWMFEETRAYVKERQAFGGPLTRLQTVQHKLAEMKTEICVGRAFVDQCIELHCERRLDGSMASMAKYWLTDLQNRIAYSCVQLFGGSGYMWESSIARAYADSRLQPIYGGTNEIMKELIARQIVSDK